MSPVSHPFLQISAGNVPCSSSCAGDRDDLLAREVARRLTELLFLVGELEIGHGRKDIAIWAIPLPMTLSGRVAWRRALRSSRSAAFVCSNAMASRVAFEPITKPSTIPRMNMTGM